MTTEFLSHPYWTLLVFGFLVCPRLLLFTLWWPLQVSLGAVISYPILSYIGFFFAPRFTLALIFAGFYWQTNEVLVVIAILISLGGESVEKIGARRFVRPGGWNFTYRKVVR